MWDLRGINVLYFCCWSQCLHMSVSSHCVILLFLNILLKYIYYTNALYRCSTKGATLCFTAGGKTGGLAYPVLIPQYGAFAKRFLRVPVVLCDFHFHPPPILDSPPRALHHLCSVKGSVVLCRQTSVGSGRRPWEPGRAGDVMWRKRS